MYHVDQQCCPGGNRPETTWRPPAGFFFPAEPFVKFVNDKLEFHIYGWNYQLFSQKIRKPPAGGLRIMASDDFCRDNIAEPHGK